LQNRGSLNRNHSEEALDGVMSLLSRNYCPAGVPLHNSRERDAVAEWQRLMRRWELAYADYTVVCAKSAAVDGTTMAEERPVPMRVRLDLPTAARDADGTYQRSPPVRGKGDHTCYVR